MSIIYSIIVATLFVLLLPLVNKKSKKRTWKEIVYLIVGFSIIFIAVDQFLN
ncbi:hypothetical protein [Oceanobacillus kimchii]|uniref:hypothetical protein n=1 Tax=Oceanobacillus kimchii TaxID=746691 RepID=UPI00158B5FFE|nr:hypothetical protein [Oceanobacillus kimchii]